ncbi:hypothetical protein ACSBLW_17770 [Thioclava sp. FR2]|uniref:hypothetical protein n=1 Tax=Thioclava sp. FR2 TaxID=3445780 RepID=UPI003EB6B200
MEEEVFDKRSVLGLASFLGLILALALAVPFTLDRAEPNQPLTKAVKGLMN